MAPFLISRGNMSPASHPPKEEGWLGPSIAQENMRGYGPSMDLEGKA